MTEEDKAKMKENATTFLDARLDGFTGMDRLMRLKCCMEGLIDVAIAAKVEHRDTETERALIKSSMDACFDEFYKIKI